MYSIYYPALRCVTFEYVNSEKLKGMITYSRWFCNHGDFKFPKSVFMHSSRLHANPGGEGKCRMPAFVHVQDLPYVSSFCVGNSYSPKEVEMSVTGRARTGHILN